MDSEYLFGQSFLCILLLFVICVNVLYSKSIIKQGGNDGYTYGKFSMGQVVGIVNARW